MIKLSIVIPYYQTFDYTWRLLKELEIQVTDEVEVILVDDGCGQFEFDEFKYLKVIHLDYNHGASYAWNRGIEAAQGEYIAFIDSDDMIMMDYVQVLLNVIAERNEDEIIFGWCDLNRGTMVVIPENRAVWKAIYKRSIIPFFDETKKVNTDEYFQRRLKAKDHSIYYLKRVIYCYNSNRKGSLTWRKHRGEFQRDEM